MADKKIPFYAWPNIVSLDAVLIAVCWQRFIAHIFQVPLSPAETVLLGIAVWLGYIGDRLIDTQKIKGNPPRSLRHQFYKRNYLWIQAIWLITLGVGVWLGWEFLSNQQLWLGWSLLIICLLYVVSIHYLPKFDKWLPKELKVALIFATGTFLFLFNDFTIANSHFWLYFASFTLLCFINCSLISAWEYHIDTHQRQPSIMHHYPKFVSMICTLGLVLGITLMIKSLFFFDAIFGYSALALGVPFICLDALHRLRKHIDSELLRVFADLSLLFPFIVLYAIIT